MAGLLASSAKWERGLRPMADDCCASACGSTSTLNDPRWRRALWIALALNLAMFGVEMIAGAAAGSRSLQADALDFFGDAANYAISLGVAGLALTWRARAAWVKGLTIFLFGFGVLAAAIWGLVVGTSPDPVAMGTVGIVALVVNVAVALMLFRYRTGDANMQSVWICSRNDAIGNLLVVGASGLVIWTKSGVPDLLVAMIMAVLGITGGWRILRQARSELAHEATDLPFRGAFEREVAQFRTARAKEDFELAWRHLERAHIIGQTSLGLHLSSHLLMLRFAFAQRDGHEVAGQLFRLAVAPFGAVTGRIPSGNTGRSNVSAFASMPVPEDLRADPKAVNDQ